MFLKIYPAKGLSDLSHCFSWPTKNIVKYRKFSSINQYHLKSPTAGIIVIGNEILSGEVLDTNSHNAMKLLYSLGVTVKKVSVIGDNINEIANEVKLFSEHYDYVLTTGGIGPTHDDVTFEAVAVAFGVNLEPNSKLIDIVSKFYKTTDLNEPGMKLAFVPANAKLTFGEDPTTGEKVNYPNISVKNVFIFPGIPQLFQKSLKVLGKSLFSSSTKFYNRYIYLNINEQLVVKILDRMIMKYPEVNFGSYPDVNNETYKVKLSIKSVHEKLVDLATEELKSNFKSDEVVKIL